jgi:negative regulator of sigma E activity
MFKNQKPITFVRFEERQGISQKTNNHYHIRQLTLSDGIESFTLNVADSVNSPFLANFNRGDQVNATTQIENRGNRGETVVIGLEAVRQPVIQK